MMRINIARYYNNGIIMRTILSLGIFLFFCCLAQALGVMLNIEQQIVDSEMIAIVDIKNVEILSGIQTRTNSTFLGLKKTIVGSLSSDAGVKRASVSLVRALYGKPDKEFVIIHDNRYVCLHFSDATRRKWF